GLLEHAHSGIDRDLAGDLLRLAARSHATEQDAVLVVALVAHHPRVAHPVLVHLHVVARAEAIDALIAGIVVDQRVAAGRAAGADAGRALQEPHPRLEAEVAARQRADRAHVL